LKPTGDGKKDPKLALSLIPLDLLLLEVKRKSRVQKRMNLTQMKQIDICPWKNVFRNRYIVQKEKASNESDHKTTEIVTTKPATQKNPPVQKRVRSPESKFNSVIDSIRLTCFFDRKEVIAEEDSTAPKKKKTGECHHCCYYLSLLLTMVF
jgi:hypothetical protein